MKSLVRGTRVYGMAKSVAQLLKTPLCGGLLLFDLRGLRSILHEAGWRWRTWSPASHAPPGIAEPKGTYVHH